MGMTINTMKITATVIIRFRFIHVYIGHFRLSFVFSFLVYTLQSINHQLLNLTMN